MSVSIGRRLALAVLLIVPQPANAVEHRGRCTVVPWIDGAAPTISVTIDGKGPYRFVVDTGAEDDGWIKPELAAQLGLPVIGKVPPDGPDDPEPDLRLFAAKSLTIGDMLFVAPKFNEMLQMGPTPQPFDGIVGSGLLARLQTAFDYRHRQLMVSEAPLVGGQVVAFERGMPIAPLTIGDRRIAAHLDTGNIAGALFVEEQVGRGLALSGPARETGKARTHYGVQSLMEAPLARPVTFGATTLPIDAVRWPPAIGLPNLGSRGLQGMVVRIDPRARRLAIEPAAGPLSCG